MKNFYRMAAAGLLLLLLCFSASAQRLIPGGNTIGLSLRTDGVAIVEFSGTLPKRAGLRQGDIITKINGKPISDAAQVGAEVAASNGAPLTLGVLRDGEEKSFTLSPLQTAEGWRLGIYVRDSVTGIGTVTYYDPDSGAFGALGHGVNDGTTLLPIRSGTVLPSEVASVSRGAAGTPGSLQGTLCGRGQCGVIAKNTPQGIFGTIEPSEGKAIETAKNCEIHPGAATIRANVRGRQVEEFAVEISAIYPNDDADRNLLLKVTDPTLLSLTGGIVQGMSGSPILQDGKLVGAVTHVLIDDPTEGYGIFIENMLAAGRESCGALNS
ncbi:MAG: PDZ domain-containing protein [Oscillospiraceae bacterium]|nr:PDZ domain-containing protein [Oscillospiraceae bacterium]